MNTLLKWGFGACLALSLLLPLRASAQKVPTNFVEEKVPAYTLPDVLKCNDGKKVCSRTVWEKKRRAEILEVFSQEMCGHVPARPEGVYCGAL